MRASRAAVLVLICAAAAAPVISQHTYDWVDPSVVLDVAPDDRSRRIADALERVPDCVQERMNLIGAHLVVIGWTPPAEHPLGERVARDFLARGWRLLAAPFVRVQGRAYPREQIAFVRRGGRGVGRSRLFTRWFPVTGRGERTALHEYGHLVAWALALANQTEFYTRWAYDSPHPMVDALSPRDERVKRQEWFARAFAGYYESSSTRERLSPDVRDYLAAIESAVHSGSYDARLLELARLAADNPYLEAARQVGERLLPASLAGELRRRGAWGLGYYGQLWYAIQSTGHGQERGSLYELLSARRRALVDSGDVERADLIHLRESCGDLARTPVCRAVRRHRPRLELWHPCLGAPITGCLVTYGPTAALLEREPGDPSDYPWLAAERHRDLALGRLAERAPRNRPPGPVEGPR